MRSRAHDRLPYPPRAHRRDHEDRDARSDESVLDGCCACLVSDEYKKLRHGGASRTKLGPTLLKMLSDSCVASVKIARCCINSTVARQALDLFSVPIRITVGYCCPNHLAWWLWLQRFAVVFFISGHLAPRERYRFIPEGG